MDPSVTAAAITAAASFAATFAGICVANKLTTYKIGQLEKKQEKFNNVIERTFKLEKYQQVHTTEHSTLDLEIKMIQENGQKQERKLEEQGSAIADLQRTLSELVIKLQNIQDGIKEIKESIHRN